MKALEDFGIELKWKFSFTKHGTTLKPLPNTVFVDVGNQLAEGIIDTHQGTKYQSSVHALSENPDLVLNHLLKGLNEAYACGEEDRLRTVKEIELTFVTHTEPDWDGIAALYLCDHLVKTGKLPDQGQLRLLVEATNEIDQGRAKMEGKIKRPYIIYYQIAGEKISNEEKILQGKNLIRDIFHALQNKSLSCESKPFLEYNENLEVMLPNYRKHLEHLAKDRELFEDDLKNSETFKLDIPLKKFGGQDYEEVAALVFSDQPKCILFKYWVRDKGDHRVMLVPRKHKETNEIYRWIISVDPNDKYDLRRLGYCLEKKEKEKRGPQDTRGGNPRWDDREYSNNSDPWYDGRDHDYTIVDGPGDGTKLALNDIREVLQGRFHGIVAKENPTDTLNFYFYFELDPDPISKEEGKAGQSIERQLRDKGFEKSKPFENFDRAFKFIQNIELFTKNDVSVEGERYEAELWVSNCTRHGVLKLETKNFHELLRTHSESTINILEDLGAIVDNIEGEAKGLAKKIGEDYGLISQIWGQQCFRFLELNQPDLYGIDRGKMERIFNRLLREKLPPDKLDQLMNGQGAEHIKSSHALCILNEKSEDESKKSKDRHLLLFYSLFLKTGYRRFSERMGGVARKLDGDGLEELGLIQEDYSEFLGDYEFSEREINTDDGLQAFFDTVLEAVGFKEQQAETRHEMETTYALAAAKKRDKLEEENRNLQGYVVGVGILALGDFIYQWATGEKWIRLDSPWVGLCVLATLLIIAILVGTKIAKKW